LAVNLDAGSEARQGLDEQGLLEVRRIMEINRIGFDEARRKRQENIFKKNGQYTTFPPSVCARLALGAKFRGLGVLPGQA